MLLDDATLQVPFLADLVTMADPTSAYSYLNFLKDIGRLYSFYIRESFFPLRREYDDYCRGSRNDSPRSTWGSPSPAWSTTASAYLVTSATGETWRGRRLVLGTGTSPRACRSTIDGPALHSADYLARKAELRGTGSITVVGSGQSAAEMYADLLAEQETHGFDLNWVTRSPRFFPMEYTKLTLEMTSPEYTAYFQALPAPTRARLLAEQQACPRASAPTPINAIFDELYRSEVVGGVDTTLLTSTEWCARRSGTARRVRPRPAPHRAGRGLRDATDVAGARDRLPRRSVPAFLEPIRDRIGWTSSGRYAASSTFAVGHADDEMFVQNGEEHTHGFVAPDLGMGALRNSVILASVLGREAYRIEKRIAFQEFGLPDRFRDQTSDQSRSA